MNIFVTSPSPVECAYNLDTKRVNKMIIETAQLLSTAVRVHGYEGDDVYKISHLNHPCSKWTRETIQNYLWTLNHGLALCSAYWNTSGKIHATEKVMTRCASNELYHLIPDGELTPFVDCTEFKHRTDLNIHERYRLYMLLKWSERDKREPKWFSRPDWAVFERNQ